MRGTRLHQGTVNHTVGATLPLTCIVSGGFSRPTDRLRCSFVPCRPEKKGQSHTHARDTAGLLTCPVSLRISGAALPETNLRTLSFCRGTEKKEQHMTQVHMCAIKQTIGAGARNIRPKKESQCADRRGRKGRKRVYRGAERADKESRGEYIGKQIVTD